MQRRTILRSFVMLPALALPLDAARFVFGQDADPSGRLEWNAARKLTWKDFNGRPPRNADADCHSWVGFDVEWSCDLNHFVFHVRTTFDPAQSWVRPGSQHPDLLRHEQAHFDLTEIAARQLRQRLTSLGDPCTSYAAMGDVDRTVSAEHNAWEQEQQRYDRETANGTNELNQQRWTARTAARLQQLKDFA